MKVPFLDLKAQYDSIREEISRALQEVLEQTAFAGGPFVTRFEEEFARYCGTRYAVGVSSGTAALWTALLALGIGPGDEVITTPSTFIATAEAISLCGATPRFVDIDERTYNMAPERLEAAITSKTKAIIPVHLFGQMADMDAIMDIAGVHGLHVIEDACQAHGAEWRGRRAGSIGDAGCFSFYPGKNLGAYGEAGAVVTDDPEVAERIRMFRDHGQRKKYYHGIVGWNARMDGFQGAVLTVKLRHLDAWNERRRANARLYRDFLADVDGIVLPAEADHAKHIYHVYAIRARDRDALIESLAQKDVHCGIHYPLPLHLQEAYESLGYGEGAFPTAELCAGQFVSLPMFPELEREQIETVCDAIKDFLAIGVS
ncbi:MAG: erythromycin biosynthesis sensory transduction protein eryC1 [Planctomycetes bacterium RBG_13_60_9]|nr:MAG: erythromycin biosynthesis sensory transduction protein eryC1 [Planctomycetes bacterium RBG_13_60_9]